MEFIAAAVLLLVGVFLVLSDISMIQQVNNGETAIFDKKVVVVWTAIIVAYYLSLAVVLL
jgi:hypothetical protein